MTPTLRPYQQQGVADIRQAFGQGHRCVLFVLPTGGGKTVLFSHVTEQAALRGNRVCVMVHRAELLRQASASLDALGVPHGLISAGRGLDLSQQVHVASVQTLARRLQKLPQDFFRLLIVDEAHHSNAGTWGQVLGHFHDAKVLGVTATPCRNDGRGLGEWYSAMVLGPSAGWLTEQGFLARARVFAPPINFSLKGLRHVAGDYDMKSASELLMQPGIYGDIVRHYRTYLDGKTAIAFCCSVAHAEATAAAFQDHGISASSIDGTMSIDRRRELLDQLGSGQLKVLTSCQLIGEGVDVPSVGGCILIRPTESDSLHLQMIGRCLRPQGDKVAVVLDHVGNVQKLGHHLEVRPWTLDGRLARSKKSLSVKVCPECFAILPSTAQACYECGHLFGEEQERKLSYKDGELVEIAKRIPSGGFKHGEMVFAAATGAVYRVVGGRCKVGDADDYCYECEYRADNGNWLRAVISESELAYATKASAQRFRDAMQKEQSQARSYEELVDIGRRRGMKHPHGWARHVMDARHARGAV